MKDTVLTGARGMTGALRGWSGNRWSRELNRFLWGRWWWLSVGAVVLLGAAVSVYLPPLATVAGLAPPLIGLVYLPDGVTAVLWSGATVVGLVVAWRCRRLRSVGAEQLPELTASVAARQLGFDAVAVPIVAMGVLLAMAVAVATLAVDRSTWILAARTGGQSIAVLAIVAGTLTSRRQVGSALGALIGAAFSWWIAHMMVGFVVPFTVSWWQYLPLPWLEGPASSAPHLAHMGLDLGVGLVAWTRLRALASTDRFWGIEPPPPPPPPPPPVPEPEHPHVSEGLG
jgi:hypothetical protein